jgi:mannuronan synthase
MMAMEDDARRLTLDDPVYLPPAAIAAGTGDHPIIDVPFSAEIDGRNYRGHGLSLVLAEIGGLLDPHLDGQTRLIHLLFSFDGFTIALSLDATVQGVDRDAGRAMVRFRDPTGPHLPQLRHILNSYIAGDLVTMGQTLGVAAANPKTGSRKVQAAPTKGAAVCQWLGTVLVGGLSFGLLGAVATVVVGRAYSTPVAAPAQVMRDGQSLVTVAAGQIDYINAQASKGEVAFSVRATSGQVMSITMPCDCAATLAGPAVGAVVLAGEPVLQLSTPGAALVLTGSAPRDDLFTLSQADHVRVEFADGTRVDATVDAASLTQGMYATTPDVAFRLLPEIPLDDARAGQLARLTIVKPAPLVIAPLVRALGAF